MKKEDKKSGVFSAFKEGLGVVSDFLFSNVFTKVHNETDVLMDKVEKKTLEMQERMIKKLAASLLVGLAVLFFIFAGFFYLIEYQYLNKTLAFLIIGVLALLFGFVMKYKILKDEKGGEK